MLLVLVKSNAGRVADYMCHVVLLVYAVVQGTERTAVRVECDLFTGVVRVWGGQVG